MRLNSFFYALVIIILFGLRNFASEYISSDKKESALKIQTEIFNDNFDKAKELSEKLLLEYPDDPIGYLFQAATYLAEMTDAEANLYQIEFLNSIDSVLHKTNAQINNSDSALSAWMYLWQGHAHAYRSLWESRFGSFSGALKQGFNAKSSYENGLQYDSSLYDLYGGIGMYHYWKSAKTGILRWLGIFKNEKQKGIDELYLTKDSSILSQATAANALIWIWLDKKEYDSVIVGCLKMLNSFPEGKLHLWPIAEAYEKKKEYDSSNVFYHRLYEKLLQNPGNYFNLIECDFKIIRNLEKLNDKEEIKRIALLFLEYHNNIPDDIKWRQRSKIAYLKRKVKN